MLLDARHWGSGEMIPPIWVGAQHTVPHNIAPYLEPDLPKLGKLQGVHTLLTA